MYTYIHAHTYVNIIYIKIEIIVCIYYNIFVCVVCVCTLFYRETVVISDSWEKTWVYSEHPDKEFGKFVLSHGKFWNDPENDKGT